MKALPVKIVMPDGYVPCSIEEATHITLNIPGPTGKLTLPVIQRDKREGTGCWTWNGSTDAPTLRPSVLTTGHLFRCHSWITDGKAQFLDDCDHSLRGQTVDLFRADLPKWIDDPHDIDGGQMLNPEWLKERGETAQEAAYPTSSTASAIPQATGCK